jgi:hypothetical protein
MRQGQAVTGDLVDRLLVHRATWAGIEADAVQHIDPDVIALAIATGINLDQLTRRAQELADDVEDEWYDGAAEEAVA